jgi:hypothetical protein
MNLSGFRSCLPSFRHSTPYTPARVNELETTYLFTTESFEMEILK